jgi:hypothetical protein
MPGVERIHLGNGADQRHDSLSRRDVEILGYRVNVQQLRANLVGNPTRFSEARRYVN